ncbi:MAG TPA: tetratricopeptide repeat protein, partial [Anaerolineales bacterium]|nr:tetratricopeptide repeat protein [Anaerolineales bacterium]
LAEPPDLARWAEFPALQLLLARVRAALPTFALTPENLLPLATLCVALDGLPLALELAAVRLRDLPPDELVQQLLTLRGNGQLSSTWLQQTKRNIAERHRTLQAAIEWSVRRLTPEQQTAFYRLGVFTGGCTEDAARAVAAPDPGLLTDLARASLIHLREGRVTLLETLRTYAAEHLPTHAPDAPAAHARYFTAFAAEVFPGVLGDEQAAWMQRALADHENCLVALRWALRHARGDIAVPLAGGLWWFWYRQGLFMLGREMLTAALQLPSSDLIWRARALNGLASFCLVQEDYAANLAYHQEGLALRRQLGDAEGVGTVLHNMGLTAITMGDFAQASAWMEASIAADPTGDPMMAWTHLGLIAQEQLDFPQARRWLEQAYQHAQPLSEGWEQAFVMNFLADVLRDMGEHAAAKTLAQSSLRIFDALNDTYYRPDPQFLLAQLAGDEGDDVTALEQATQALAQYEARQDAVVTAWVQLFLAELAWKRGDREAASAWFTQADALRKTVKRPLTPREQGRYAALREKL